MRRTKIICTVGPKSKNSKILGEMLAAGMDIARINFSHGSREEHREMIIAVREASRAAGKRVAILADLGGPKIRTGELENAMVVLKEGDLFDLTTSPVSGTEREVFVGYPHLPAVVGAGDAIFLADGQIELRVESVSGDRVVCRVAVGGNLTANQGVNLPGKELSLSPITEKDKEDLRFALESNADWIAMSFVRKPEDIASLRALMKEGPAIPVIAKIERREAACNIEQILEAADAVMVARGDLGVEIPTEEVPIVQKKIISTAMRKGRPVITATQMLESMVRAPRPTRAEASDVANAIFDGTDAVMLSAETAVGKYPVEAVKVMSSIAERTEANIDYAGLLAAKASWVVGNVTDAISYAACELAADIGAKAIVTATQTGTTARRVSKYRPPAPIIALSSDPAVVGQLTLSWGVMPVEVPASGNVDETLAKAHEVAVGQTFVGRGDRIVITAGALVNVPGTTNLIKIEEIS